MNHLEVLTEVDLLSKVLDCVKEIDRTHEQEKTRRYEIQKKCELANKLIEAHSEQFKKGLIERTNERQSLLNMLESLTSRPVLDESVITLSSNILGYLRDTAPTNMLNSAPDYRALL